MPIDRREETIDEILAESFPASDPPPWTCGLEVRRTGPDKGAPAGPAAPAAPVAPAQAALGAPGARK